MKNDSTELHVCVEVNSFFQRKRALIVLLMRISAINLLFVLSCTCLAYSKPAKGQSIENTKVELEFDKASLKSVFAEIEDQTDFSFAVPTHKINTGKHKISLEAGIYTVKEALDLMLKKTGIVYAQSENFIFISLEKEGKNSAAAARIDQQSNNNAALITGTVKDATTQDPLAGVNIIVKGTTKGTTSDVQGKYAIDANSNDVLVFSFIGFKTFEIQVSGRFAVDVLMEVEVAALQEVVVNAGYWKVKEKESTGNISKIISKEIEKQPITNPLQSIQGRTPGVYILQQNGLPGGNFTVRIRGRNSINSGNDPLYIIDGVPYLSEALTNTVTSGSLYAGNGTSPLNNINPSDIESIEILKDADATAVYGSRGANGVILIMTKKASLDKTKFDFSLNTGISTVSGDVNLLNTQQYLGMMQEALRNESKTPAASAYDVNGTWDTTRYTNWQNELIGGTAKMTNIHASYSAGNNSTSFLLRGSFQKQTTVFPGDLDYNKVSTLISTNHTSKDKRFDSSISMNYVVDKNKLPSIDFTSLITLAPNSPALYQSDGNLNWENSTWDNPLAELERIYVANTNNLIGNSTMSYRFFSWLEVKAALGFNDIRFKETKILPSTYYNPVFGSARNASSNSILNSSNYQSWIIEPQFNFKRDIFKGLLQVLLGSTFQSQKKEQFVITGTGFTSDALIYDINSAASIDVINNSSSEYRYNAVFTRINYNWDGKYILNLTGRRDGSSRFGPGKQFANFGALGAAWIFSNERLIRDNLRFLSFGKIRLSYGSTGNDQIGDYQYLDTYTSLNGGTYQGVNGLVPSRPFNPDFAWEVNKKFEIGISTGFMNDKMLLSFSYYHNRSSSQLVGYPLALTTGFNTIQSNFPATVQNTGMEIEITSLNIVKNAFNWESSFNLTIPRNKLVKFAGLETSPYASQYVVGEPLNILKTYQYLGVDPTTGVYQFVDMNGDGVVSPNDRLSVEKIGERLYGGINNSVRFKRLQLDLLFQFVDQAGSGQWKYFTSWPGAQFSNQPVGVLENRWQNDGDEAGQQRFATITNSLARTAYNQFRNSDAAIVDASFVRLKNLSLAYNIELLKSINCQIYFQAQNLITITKYKGLDPENYSVRSLPPLRTIVGGFKIQF